MGLWPFYNELKEKESCQMILQGEMPYIDPWYHNQLLIEGCLVHIMNQCLQYQLEDHANIFHVVEHLQETMCLDDATQAAANANAAAVAQS